MKQPVREAINKLFTSISAMSVIFMAAALVLILGPLLYRGSKAVVFKGTVEFRRMQYAEPLFHRGDGDALDAENERVEAARRPLYAILDRFGAALDPSVPSAQAKRLYRETRKQLRNQVEDGRLSEDRYDELSSKARRVRNTLLDAYASCDNAEAAAYVEQVLTDPDRAAFDDTVGKTMFDMAAGYGQTLAGFDLARREKYQEEFIEVRDLVTELLGPRESAGPPPELINNRYGATRWDTARDLLERLRWKERWVSQGEGEPLVKEHVARAELFAGTEMEKAFEMLDDDVEAMLNPTWTFYWQYFIDDSPPSHYFGGVWPEIFGTLMLTALAMLAAVPVGVVTAAYLVECTRDNLLVRAIRTCINTLAGVPSIVFGLFGLALFMETINPMLGLEPKRCILAGSLTLAVLVLPIIIRASEEAIKAVPPTYKEAALSVGAGGLRTFLTVTLPAALPGVLTGIILSMSRAAGETAPILFVAAVWSRQGVPDSLFQGGTRALSYSSYMVAVGDRVAMDQPHTQYGMTMTLILLVGLLNVAAIVLRWRVSRRLRGA